MLSCFVKNAKYYTERRDLRVEHHWRSEYALYLSRMKNISVEEAREWIDWAIKNNKIDYIDPPMDVLKKDHNRDRYATSITFNNWLNEVSQFKLIVAGNMTSYLRDTQLYSELGGFTEVRFYERKSVKKEGQKLKTLGDIIGSIQKGDEQNNKKTTINSISGALTIESTPIANRSGHSTLTSTCRIAAAMSNVNTERLLGGRRVFIDGPTVIDNICSVIQNTDIEQAMSLINKYNFKMFDKEMFMKLIRRSTDKYISSGYWLGSIEEFVDKLSSEEMTVYAYMGDFYHLRKYNEDFVRGMIDEIKNYDNIPPLSDDEVQEELKNVDEFYGMLIAMLINHYVGKESFFSDKHKDKDYYGKIGSTIKYVRETLMSYSDYFLTFWSTDSLPPDHARFNHAIRDNTLGGDTDSTLYTVMNWTKWYHRGDISVNRDSRNTSQIFIYMLSMVVAHSLATIAGTMGVNEKYIFNLKMKNEFFFDVFAPSNRTKHYCCAISACEGNVYNEPELELKGVAMKNSKSTVEINNGFQDKIMEIMKVIAGGGKIRYQEYIDTVASIENDILNKIMMGDTEYLTSKSIKAKNTYKIPMSSDYANYELWEFCFADKYGHCNEPPYEGVRIALNLPNPTAIKTWLSTMKDQSIAGKLDEFFQLHGRKAIASIILPYEVVVVSGIPEEIKSAINVRKIIFANTEPYYIFDEMLGIYRQNKWLTKMFLDDRLDWIDERHKSYFLSREDTMGKIRDGSKHAGKMYETWDREVIEYNLDEDGNIVFNDDKMPDNGTNDEMDGD